MRGGRPEVGAGKISAIEGGQLSGDNCWVKSFRIRVRNQNQAGSPSQYSTEETSGSLRDIRSPVAGIEYIEDTSTVPQS